MNMAKYQYICSFRALLVEKKTSKIGLECDKLWEVSIEYRVNRLLTCIDVLWNLVTIITGKWNYTYIEVCLLKSLYLIGGTMGIGKTTVCQRLKEE